MGEHKTNLNDDQQLPKDKLDQEIVIREQASALVEALLGMKDPDEEVIQAAIELIQSIQLVKNKIAKRTQDADS